MAKFNGDDSGRIACQKIIYQCEQSALRQGAIVIVYTFALFIRNGIAIFDCHSRWVDEVDGVGGAVGVGGDFGRLLAEGVGRGEAAEGEVEPARRTL